MTLIFHSRIKDSCIIVKQSQAACNNNTPHLCILCGIENINGEEEH